MRAAAAINHNLMGQEPSYSVLMWCILVPSLLGVALAYGFHLWMGLLG